MRSRKNTLPILITLIALLISGLTFLMNDYDVSKEKEDSDAENCETDKGYMSDNSEVGYSEQPASEKTEKGDYVVPSSRNVPEGDEDAHVVQTSEAKDTTDKRMPYAEEKPMENPESDPNSYSEEDVTDLQSDYKLPTSLPDQYYSFEGHTYGFYDASCYGFQSYKQVMDFCSDQGGHLAVINSQEENNYLFNLVRQNYIKTVFFGYSDELIEGNWEWAYGNSTYENWTTYGTWDLPDNGYKYGGDEDYAEFNYERGKSGIPNDGTWNDAPFRSNTDVFLCEWEFDINAL